MRQSCLLLKGSGEVRFVSEEELSGKSLTELDALVGGHAYNAISGTVGFWYNAYARRILLETSPINQAATIIMGEMGLLEQVHQKDSARQVDTTAVYGDVIIFEF